MPQKKARFVSVTVLAFLLLAISVLPTSAIPQLPNQFWGTVAVGVVSVLDSSIVSARIGGVEYASSTTSGGQYSIIVPGDDPDTVAKEGGVAGDTVEFYVKGYRSNVWVLGGSATFTHGEVTKLDLVITDAVAPAVTIDAVTTPTNVATQTLTGSFTDAFISEVRIERGGIPIATATLPSDGQWSAIISLIEGSNALTARAIDLAGNEGTAATTIVLDTTPSTVTLPAYTPDPTTNRTPTYSGTATDATTNVVDIEYRVDGGAWTDVAPFTPALSVSFTFTTPALADGTHLIEVRVRDAAGNLSAIASDTLTVITAVPPPPDFTISVSPTSGSVVQGGSAVATVSITSIGGFTNTVSLSASGLPSGATAPFSPSSGTPSFTSTLTISTSSTTPAGTYAITITGTGGGKTHACTYTLTVTPVVPIPSEIIEVESPPIEIPFIAPDVPREVTVEGTNITGLTIDTLVPVENVRIIVQQLTDRPATIAIGPPGLVYQYFNIVVENLSDDQIESVTIRFRIEKSWIAQNGIDIQTITLNRYDPVTEEWTSLPTTFLSEDDTYAYFSAVSPGLSVFGISGQPLQPDFTISVSPTSGTVEQGESITATVSLTSIAGFAETVSLTASGLPSGATATFSPSSGTPSFSSVLTISTVSTTPTGTYTITITGTGGGKTHSCAYTLTVTPAAVPPEEFPWELAIGIIAAIVIILAAVIVLYKRKG